jgi:hypothetical protein
MTPSRAVVALVLILGGCTAAQPLPAATPSPTDTPVGSAASPGNSAPGATEPTEDFEAQAPEGSLAAGTYRLRYASIGGADRFPTLAFTVPAGWARVRVDGLVWNDRGIRVGFVIADNVYVDPCDADAGLRQPPVGESVDDLTRAVAALPGWTVTRMSEEMLYGFSGKVVELVGPAAVSTCTDEQSRLLHTLGSPGFVPAISPDEHHELRVVNAAGTRVVIVGVSGSDVSDADRVELSTVMDSVRIEP